MVDKVKVTYYIEKELRDKFDKLAKEKAINKSAKVEQLIKEFVEKIRE